MGGNFEWPSVEKIFHYRVKVRKIVLDIIDTLPLELPITQDSPWVSIRRVHIEFI